MTGIKSVIVSIAAILLLSGSYITMSYASAASSAQSSMERYQLEMKKIEGGSPYEELLDEESRAQYEKMNRQMDEILQKEEQTRTKWMYIFIICAIPPLMFMGFILYSYINDKTYRPKTKEVIVVSCVTIALGMLLYLMNVLFFYLKFYANEKIQALIVFIAMIIAAVFLYHYNKKKKKK